MSMLSRYHKAGGFLQLLQLIETCGKQKQDSFLSMIEGEDSRWATAIKEKMLSNEKMLSWPNEVLAEIAVRVQPLTLGTYLHSLSPENRARFLVTFSHSQKRNIEDVINSKSPTPAELSSAVAKMLTEVRGMITAGHLRPDKFAPEMIIPENFEENIGKAPQSAAGTAPEQEGPLNLEGFGNVTSMNSHSTSTKGSEQELNNLRNKMNVLVHENNQLKAEVKNLRDRLTQIKKIA